LGIIFIFVYLVDYRRFSPATGMFFLRRDRQAHNIAPLTNEVIAAP